MSDTATIASRCIEDPAFARQVLEGDEYPEVRTAIVADAVDGAEVAGFFNPQPDPPRADGGDLMKFDRVGDQWGQLSLPQLHLLATPLL
jgi:hypothetical protein